MGKGEHYRNRVGQRHEKLLVLEFAGMSKSGSAMWLCRCDCGKTVVVNGAKIAVHKSCGCARAKLTSLVGRVFGRLTVVEFDGYNWNKHGKKVGLWKCKCLCGQESIVMSNNLLNGGTRSCGCGHRKFPFGYANFKQVYKGYVNKAKEVGRKFELSEEEVYHMFGMDCFYCGRKPANVCNSPDPDYPFIYNGIDRYDNAGGYVKGNVLPCCKMCNIAKRDVTVHKFLDWIVDVYNHLNLDSIN